MTSASFLLFIYLEYDYRLTVMLLHSLVESPFAPAVAPYVGTLVSAADGAYLAGQLAAGKKITGKD